MVESFALAGNYFFNNMYYDLNPNFNGHFCTPANISTLMLDADTRNLDGSYYQSGCILQPGSTISGSSTKAFVCAGKLISYMFFLKYARNSSSVLPNVVQLKIHTIKMRF